MFRLVVGVGNPGPQYALTKHNIAWLLFDSFPLTQGASWKSKFKGEYCDVDVRGQKTTFLKPQTYMNLSGESVQPLAAFYKITPQEILVVHDEVDIPFGQVHFKMGGGLAGHNGLKSITELLGTENFGRMRIGVGRPVHGSMADWVLAPFAGDMKIQLPLLLEKLHGPLEDCVLSGISKVSVLNKKSLL